jgi:cell division septum initiation protein DivIVA
MNNLKKSITGKYNAEDVDELLKKVRDDYEDCLKEQKDRIMKLRDENKEMTSLIEMYKNNEKYLVGAITKAEETAQSIISEAENKAKERLEILKNEELQMKVAIEGCSQRLYKLKRASEAIFRAVAKIMGDHEEDEKMLVQYSLRPVKNFPAANISE